MVVLTEVDERRIADLLERDEFFWIDLHAPGAEALDRIGGMRGLHPMAMEDTREFGQRPKVDVYESHVLVVFYTARLSDADRQSVAVPLEVHVYVSGRFVVTVRRADCDLLDDLHGALVSEGTEAED